MKKLLNFLLTFSLSCGSTMPLISCGNIANNKPHLPPSKPKEPIIKDFFYYEKLKQEITAEIKEYDEVIKEIENSKSYYENEKDYQTELKQTQGEKFIKISELNNWDYQILLCQKEIKFTDEQKKQAIKLLENQINNLNSALNLLNEIKNSDFDQKDLEKSGHKVWNSHIDDGIDFFNYIKSDVDRYEYIISNPPFSKRKQVIEYLFNLGKPFAMWMPLVSIVLKPLREKKINVNYWCLIKELSLYQIME